MKSNISLIITVYNEADTIDSLIESLASQTIQPKEVIIVDGGSTDETWSLLQSLQTSADIHLKVFQKSGNRSVGRNYAISQASSALVAITDAGCLPHPDWLEELGNAYFETSASVIAGYYSARPETPFEEAVIPYVLVMPDKVNPLTFLPATRSMMIEKKVWQELNGFNEQLSDNEDYDFAQRLRQAGYEIAFAPKARVRWIPRSDLLSFGWMIYRFARGDVQAGLIRPKVIVIFARYMLVGLLVTGLLLTNKVTSLLFLLGFLLLLYSTWAIFKNLRYVPNGWYWLPVLQIVSDIEVMVGSVSGFFRKKGSSAKNESNRLQKIANLIVNQSLKITAKDHVLILVHETGMPLASQVTELAKEIGAEVICRLHQTDAIKAVLEDLAQFPIKDAQEKIVKGIGKQLMDDALWGTKFLIIWNNTQSKRKFEIPDELQKMYDQVATKARRERNDNHPWMLVYVPNQEEADLAGMSLADYTDMFYSFIDRPWEAVSRAQSILVKMLKGKKKFRVVAKSPNSFPDGWDTDVSMSIEGMVGLNSTIEHNLPGSEVYLAPVTETIEGTYAIPYPVMFKERVLPNIKLIFKKGSVASFDVYYPDTKDPTRKADLDYVRKILNLDKGANQVGELGIGTNPEINQAFLNPLLIEKVGGSVHLALGNSYKNLSKDVQIDNGNRSTIHIDLTRILLPEFGGGRIEVDGKVIQDNGRFLDPALQILNKA